MSTKSRAERLQAQMRGLESESSYTYRRPVDGAKLVVQTSRLLDSFFAILGGERPALSEKARRFLRDVPVHSRMADVHALPILEATGQLGPDAEPPIPIPVRSELEEVD